MIAGHGIHQAATKPYFVRDRDGLPTQSCPVRPFLAQPASRNGGGACRYHPPSVGVEIQQRLAGRQPVALNTTSSLNADWRGHAYCRVYHTLIMEDTRPLRQSYLKLMSVRRTWKESFTATLRWLNYGSMGQASAGQSLQSQPT